MGLCSPGKFPTKWWFFTLRRRQPTNPSGSALRHKRKNLKECRFCLLFRITRCFRRFSPIWNSAQSNMHLKYGWAYALRKFVHFQFHRIRSLHVSRTFIVFHRVGSGSFLFSARKLHKMFLQSTVNKHSYQMRETTAPFALFPNDCFSDFKWIWSGLWKSISAANTRQFVTFVYTFSNFVDWLADLRR